MSDTDLPPVLESFGDNLDVAMKSMASNSARSWRELVRRHTPYRRVRRWLRRPLVVGVPALAPQRRGSPARLVRTLMTVPRGWVALAGSTSAAVVAVLLAFVLAAGTAPTAAQAFPILTRRATDISDTSAGILSRWLTPTALHDALQHAHAFSITDGTAYVIESPDGDTLCLLATPTTGPTAGNSWGGACSPTVAVEQTGTISAFNFAPGIYDFVALVPAGGSAQLTDNGTTAPVSASDGVATGVVHDTATLTIDVGSSTYTRQVGAQVTLEGPPANQPLPAQGATQGATNFTGSTASTGDTGASS